MLSAIRRVVIGEPLKTSDFVHQRLTKVKALAVFSSDALSSSAYATEAILLVLVAAGSIALGLSWYIALGIAALLLIVAFSYFQTIHAYPNGGGAYIVSKDNLGTGAGLVAASSLLIDYTLTVAVSVSAGVAALSSAFPALQGYRIPMALLIVVFITVMNLRGVKESGTFFSIPTYAFIAAMLTMIAFGVFKVVLGDVPAEPVDIDGLEESGRALTSLTLFLVLRAYAAGCTALTGVEAISNGIPAFEEPESSNAAKTLISMVLILSTMFLGITFLANHYPVIVSEEVTILSQLGRLIFGEGSVLFFFLQFSTLFILSLAANTAFADFPRLSSLIAQDRYLPRQLTNLGDRLVFSNGIILLVVMASILIVIFRAREHNLLPLYAVGVFLSFTLSQLGMVIHWLKARKKPGFKPTWSWRFKLALNAFGALCTFVVLNILLITKFVEGAWIVAVAIPLVVLVFVYIHRHYKEVAHSLSLGDLAPYPIHPTLIKCSNNMPIVVLANSLNRASLQAIEYAIHLSDNVRVCAIGSETQAIEALKAKWNEWHIEIPLDIVESPYRELANPLLDYLHERDHESGVRVPVMVIMPEFVVEHWWDQYLHNQTAKMIKFALSHDHIERGRGRPVLTVPYQIGEELYEPQLSPRRILSDASVTH